MIEALRAFIASYPGFAGKVFQVDRLGAQPQDAALYCMGRQTLWQRKDILGGVTQRQRLTCKVLVRCIQPQQLLDLVHWAQENCPALGQDQTLHVEKGALKRAGADGMATYEATLRLEWTENN